VNAPELLAVLLAGTFQSWDTEPVDVRPDPGYAADLAQARRKTGLDESVITGEGLIAGHRVAVAASEFGFLGGSIGVAAAERLTGAVERATAERLPVIALPASGGTRMQEGTVAFVQMVKITAAVQAHRAAHLPYVVYLRNPTMGGVFASWGSLGHLTLAEPGALIGFLGPRAAAALSGSRFPGDVQTAENLHAHGLIDAVVAAGELAAFLGRVLTAMTAQPRRPARPDPTGPAVPGSVPAWESVLRTREADRPGAGDLIRLAATDVVWLRRAGLIVALARIGGYPCALIAHDRAGPAPGPATLRLARRGARLAAGLGLPLVCVIDTPGAELSARAEQDGLAAEIARCLADLITLPVPTVSLLLGQGAGAAALALLPADRVLAAQHAWLAPLAPEGASAIVYRDPDPDHNHAAELAARQRIRSADLAADGLVDLVIPETPGDAGRFCRDLGDALHRALSDLAHQDDDTRLASRLRRYRRLGVPPRGLLSGGPSWTRETRGGQAPAAPAGARCPARCPAGNPSAMMRRCTSRTAAANLGSLLTSTVP
jgi:acetyl-CoA carboxylase carboxyl transferase subunit beta